MLQYDKGYRKRKIKSKRKKLKEDNRTQKSLEVLLFSEELASNETAFPRILNFKIIIVSNQFSKWLF